MPLGNLQSYKKIASPSFTNIPFKYLESLIHLVIGTMIYLRLLKERCNTLTSCQMFLNERNFKVKYFCSKYKFQIHILRLLIKGFSSIIILFDVVNC